MTRDEILSATPKWLNKKAAEAMGWKFIDPIIENSNSIGIDEYCYESIDGIFEGKIVLVNKKREYKVWNPAEDIRDAWELVDFIGAKGYHFEVERNPCENHNYASAFGILKFPFKEYGSYGKTASEAITKAFLLACLEVDNGK